MSPESLWSLSQDVTRTAQRRAAEAIALQAEVLADEIEVGALADFGGPEALRLFAALVRHLEDGFPEPLGHA